MGGISIWEELEGKERREHLWGGGVCKGSLAVFLVLRFHNYTASKNMHCDAQRHS